MRLSNLQIQKINATIRQYVGVDTQVYLFGSRTDDTTRGGDVDLLIVTSRPISRLQRARLKVKLESALGLPVDLIVKSKDKDTKPFEKIALNSAESLEENFSK